MAVSIATIPGNQRVRDSRAVINQNFDALKTATEALQAESNASTELVTQPNHGFALLHAIYQVASGLWVGGRADSNSTAFCDGVVIEVLSANQFRVAIEETHSVPGLSLNPGVVYYLSDSSEGLLTITPPTAEDSFLLPVLRAIDATTFYLLPRETFALSPIADAELADMPPGTAKVNVGGAYSKPTNVGLPSLANHILPVATVGQKLRKGTLGWEAYTETAASFAPITVPALEVDVSTVRDNGTVLAEVNANGTLAFTNIAANNGKNFYLVVTNKGTYTLAWSNATFGGATPALSHNATDLFHVSIVGPTAYVVRLQAGAATDTVKPTITGATLNSAHDLLTISLSEAVRNGGAGIAGFALTSSTAVAITLSGHAIAGDGLSITAVPSRIVSDSEVLTLAYTQPGDGVEDMAGNDMLTVGGIAVTVPPLPVVTPPTYFTVTKGETMFMGASSQVYSPCLVDFTAHPTFPYNYAIYCSSDHGGGVDGIHLYVCGRKSTGGADPRVAANWKSYNAAVAEGGFAAYSSKPAANPIFYYGDEGSGTETPCVNLIGDVAYMLFQQNLTPDTASQSTCLATAADGLNFTAYKAHSGGTTAIVMSPKLTNPGGGNHTGYVKWGLNPFPFGTTPYTYLAYGLWRDTNYARGAQWGSNDAINWTFISTVDFDYFDAFADDSWKMSPTVRCNPHSVRALGDGTFAALVSAGNVASGVGAIQGGDTYEAVFDATGRKIIKEIRVVNTRGPAGSVDERSPGRPDRLFTYAGQLFGVSAIAGDTSTETGDPNRRGLRIFTVAFNAGATPASPRVPSDAYDTEVGQNFRGASAFTSSLIAGNGGTATWGADGVTVTTSSSVFRGIRQSIDIPLAGKSMIEVFAEDWMTGASGTFEVTIGEATYGLVADGIGALSYGTISYQTAVRTRAGGASIGGSSEVSFHYWGGSQKISIGLRWFPALGIAQLLGADRSVVHQWSAAGVPGSLTAVRPQIIWTGSGSQKIGAFWIRTKNA